MSQLVTDHVEGFEKAREDHAVPTSEHHLPPQKRVIVADAPVDETLQAHAAVVDGVPIENGSVEFAGAPRTLERPADGLIGGAVSVFAYSPLWVRRFA